MLIRKKGKWNNDGVGTSVTVHSVNHFSKEGFETGIFIGPPISGKKPRPVREYSAVASHRQ